MPLVSDASSDIFSRPIDVAKHALIYAGAQKNLAPAGVTLVIIREDMLQAHAVVAADDAAVRACTPRTSRCTTRRRCSRSTSCGWCWRGCSSRAGWRRWTKRNARKADKLYAEIDRTGYYRGHAQKDSRSRMNVTFRLPSEDLEKKFAKDATAAGLDGLKGHRSVGGMRASIYNAFPEEGVDALVAVHGGVRTPERLNNSARSQ